MNNEYFEELLSKNEFQKCNNTSTSNESQSFSYDPTAGANTNECKYANLDAKYGFQDVPPILITTLTEIIANIIAGRMPVNLANAFGNWIQLVAQVIAVYNSQQQYQQSGPGRFFDPAYKNIGNPFCENQSKPDGAEQVAKVRKKNKKNKKTNNIKSTEETIREDDTGEIKEIITALQKENEELKRELQELRDMINLIKG